MNIDKSDTAVVIIDPQNEVLSERGLAWPLVRESLQENRTIENIERVFKAAKARGFEVFISPHYFYPTDKGWKFNGPLETDEATSGMFARKGVLDLDGLEGSGAIPGSSGVDDRPGSQGNGARFLKAGQPHVARGRRTSAGYGKKTRSLVLGNGEAGKYLAWTMAREVRRPTTRSRRQVCLHALRADRRDGSLTRDHWRR